MDVSKKKTVFFYHFLAGELKNNMNMDNNRRWKCMQIWPFVKLGIHEQNRFQTVAYEGTSAFGWQSGLMYAKLTGFLRGKYTVLTIWKTAQITTLHCIKSTLSRTLLCTFFFHFFTWLLQWGCPPLVWQLKSGICLAVSPPCIYILLVVILGQVIEGEYAVEGCFVFAARSNRNTQVCDLNSNGCCWDQKIWMTMPEYPPIALNVPSPWCW